MSWLSQNWTTLLLVIFVLLMLRGCMGMGRHSGHARSNDGGGGHEGHRDGTTLAPLKGDAPAQQRGHRHGC